MDDENCPGVRKQVSPPPCFDATRLHHKKSFPTPSVPTFESPKTPMTDSFLSNLSDILGNNFLSSLDAENTEQQGHRSTYHTGNGSSSYSNDHSGGAGLAVGIVFAVVAFVCIGVRVLW